MRFLNKITLLLFLNLCLLANANAGINSGLVRLTLSQDGTQAYILESIYMTNFYKVTRCNVNPDGSLSGCFSHQSVDDLSSIAVHPNKTAYFGSHSIGYDPAGHYITRCNMDNNITCTKTYGLPQHVNEPLQIALNPAGTRAYFANFASGDQLAPSMVGCDINPADGSFASCKNVLAPSSEMPAAMTFNSKGTVAYYTTLLEPDFKSSVVHRYTVNSQGELSDDLPLNFKTEIDDFQINPAGNKAYTVNATGPWSSVINRCDINPTDGSLSNCTLASDESLCNPLGIAFNPHGTTAYVTSADSDTYLYKCTVNGDGNLKNCAQIGLNK